ncbi:MAG: hypothetical protein R3279_11500 [Putridiphycobacter sp.]|nr:hypothetical protein [Putridiphycobacter sp.]
MKKGFIVFTVLFICFSVQSCKKRGCTISYAANFDATAIKDDKSCTFYYKTHINGIKVLDFPEFDPNGAFWDAGGLPDLYVRITDKEDAIKYQTPVITEVAPEDTVEWSIPVSVTLDTISANSQFKLYEVDETSAELIEKFPINFVDYMHESTSGLDKYPDSILFSGNSATVVIYLNWVE